MFESYIEILAILAIITGVISSLAYFMQIYKMHKRKSSADISLNAYLVWFFSSVIWLFYGLAINDFPLIITLAIGLIGTIIVIILYFVYKK